ncbi:hypothetical protein FB567DRAFT_51976 [Paraphoma chrysanthemicola]|uniref:Uncharacterized protein n=1 Tax=Paraphoma chrysanthemicola TaxID=798071 RepID=A0A8K0R7H2_9PLEO|nr:hypothetical protein FB567DRAFT_51976 [Paraphoma chrysanthemicola]
MSAQPIHSTGRGGAGNIGPDDHVYTDGGIVREGVQGDSLAGGRGGAGNIAKSPHLGPQSEQTGRRSQDFVPEISAREGQDEFHTGVSFRVSSTNVNMSDETQRGGAGNVYKEKHGGHSSSQSPERKGLGDKIKQALHLDKDKKHEPSPLANEATPPTN